MLKHHKVTLSLCYEFAVHYLCALQSFERVVNIILLPIMLEQYI